MVVVYIDLEYTNGNFYLGDVIEIAATGGESGWIFRKYINIGYKLSPLINGLTGITDEKLHPSGVSFNEAFEGLSSFIRQEQRGSNTELTLISHGGTHGEFSILLANCMKKDIDYDFLRECIFIDSAEAFKNNGYSKPGLDTLCRLNNIVNVARHSAADDANVLKLLCSTHPSIFGKCHTLSFTDVLGYLLWRLPIPISILRVTVEYVSERQLVNILRKFQRDRTA